ncbi:MAG: glycogen/starch synthase, partial [Muribaculaceae bacterium]|nr:glycogen/starch synthase [Muribaculaceae bacterium]
MAENNKILYINQEINPYVAESFRSMLARGLHQGMQEAGFEVRTFMPKYAIINERKNQLHEVIRLS